MSVLLSVSLFGSSIVSSIKFIMGDETLQAGSAADRAPTTIVTSFPSTPQGIKDSDSFCPTVTSFPQSQMVGSTYLTSLIFFHFLFCFLVSFFATRHFALVLIYQ